MQMLLVFSKIKLKVEIHGKAMARLPSRCPNKWAHCNEVDSILGACCDANCRSVEKCKKSFLLGRRNHVSVCLSVCPTP